MNQTNTLKPKPASLGPARSLWQSFRRFAADIKLAHSVFALPFAASALLLGNVSLPSWSQLGLLLVCMVTARSFAMGINRFLDRHIDGQNPRTRGRQIPSGGLTAFQGISWSMFAGALFCMAAAALNPLSGWLSLPLLMVLATYSLLKRSTWLVHWYLGLCLGLAPVAVCIALTGGVSLAVVLLGLAVALWTAGFDILYSLQDLAFDRAFGLRSIPARFGAAASLWISRACFAGMVVLLLAVGLLTSRGIVYFLGVAAMMGLLAYEHYLVRDARTNGSSKNINAAFFNANAYVSVIFYAVVQTDYLLGAYHAGTLVRFFHG